MTLHPAAIALGGFALDPTVQRAIGIGLLSGAILLLAALGPASRPVNLFGWTLTLPSRTQGLAQIGIACIDLAFASAALFVLVPHLSPALYPAFFLGYALAIIAALISHVPGGIGIFEGVIVATLPNVEQPVLIAALIAYRILYYLVPLFVAVILITAHESHGWRRADAGPRDRAHHVRRSGGGGRHHIAYLRIAARRSRPVPNRRGHHAHAFRRSIPSCRQHDRRDAHPAGIRPLSAA
jgi:hypothetical protein